MKIERHTGLHVNARQTVVPAAHWNASGTQRSFESALRDQRQRVASSDKSEPQRSETSSVTSRRTDTAERNERSRASMRQASERETPSVDRRQAAANAFVEDSPIPAFIDRSLAARWRRAAGIPGAAECIEVVHAATGSRFLLSRENGIWLLSIQSRACPEDDDAIVLALRELFTRRGLGALDVVKL